MSFELECEKNENKQKSGRDWPVFLKKNVTVTVSNNVISASQSVSVESSQFKRHKSCKPQKWFPSRLLLRAQLTIISFTRFMRSERQDFVATNGYPFGHTGWDSHGRQFCTAVTMIHGNLPIRESTSSFQFKWDKKDLANEFVYYQPNLTTMATFIKHNSIKARYRFANFLNSRIPIHESFANRRVQLISGPFVLH